MEGVAQNTNASRWRTTIMILDMEYFIKNIIGLPKKKIRNQINSATRLKLQLFIFQLNNDYIEY